MGTPPFAVGKPPEIVLVPKATVNPAPVAPDVKVPTVTIELEPASGEYAPEDCISCRP